MSLLNKFYTTTSHYLFMFPEDYIPPQANVCYPAAEPYDTAHGSLKRMEKELGFKIHLIKPGELIYFVQASSNPARPTDYPNYSTLVISGERTGWIWASMHRFNIAPVVVEEE